MFLEALKKYTDKSTTRSNRELLLKGNLVQAILMLAIPVVINSFLQTMYNLTDTYWLGKLGTEELAAEGVFAAGAMMGGGRK